MVYVDYVCFFFQAEDGIRDLVRSRGLGDVYKRQALGGDGAGQLRQVRSVGLAASHRSHAREQALQQGVEVHAGEAFHAGHPTSTR